jgi:CRP/FNR family cyclic AMP-dependent transcriptional regulator
MTLAEALGYLASGLVLLTFGMKTMVAMRMVAIGSNLAFIAYGLSLELTPIWALHSILLPLNTYRLFELQRRMRDTAEGDLSFALLLPFMAKRRFAKGEILFRKGDVSHEMFYVLKGRVCLREIDTTIGEGDVLGAISVSPGRQRTVTAFCETDGELLAVSDTEVTQLNASKNLAAGARI